MEMSGFDPAPSDVGNWPGWLRRITELALAG
jgi:hypothetical protein